METRGGVDGSVYSVPKMLKIHEDIVSHELLDESSAFLESLRVAVTTGKVSVCTTMYVPTRIERVDMRNRGETHRYVCCTREYMQGESVCGKRSVQRHTELLHTFV